MPHIKLAVTADVLAQVQAGQQHQTQLAIQGSSPDVNAQVQNATANNLISIAVGGAICLVVGDTGAIWRVHQAGGQQTDDFNSLFDLLARRPGTPLTFTW